MPEITSISERLTALKDQFTSFVQDVKHEQDEERRYRHDMREQMQRLVVDHASDLVAHQNTMKLVEQLMVSHTQLSHRVELLEQRKTLQDGGFQVVKFVWAAVGALLMLAISYVLKTWKGNG